MKEAPEIGWAFAARAHGKGFATEAVRAAVAWGDERFGAARTVCLMNPDNLTSIRVAKKCGYHEFKRSQFKWQAGAVLRARRDRLTRRSWQDRRQLVVDHGTALGFGRLHVPRHEGWCHRLRAGGFDVEHGSNNLSTMSLNVSRGARPVSVNLSTIFR